jgi:hypothetical protein
MDTESPPVSALQLEALFCPVGELIINWSLLDSQIVKIVAIIYHAAEGKQQEAQMPFEFKRRVKFLRRCVSRIPALSVFVNDINKLITTATELTIVRDAIIHGAISAYDEKDRSYSFVKLDIDRADNLHIANTVKMTLADIETSVVESQTTMKAAIALSQRLSEMFVLIE